MKTEYGDKDIKKLEVLKMYSMIELNNEAYPIGYIYKRGLLLDYVVGSWFNSLDHEFKGKKGRAFEVYPPLYEYRDVKTLKKYKYRGDVYYLGKVENLSGNSSFRNEVFGIFRLSNEKEEEFIW